MPPIPSLLYHRIAEVDEVDDPSELSVLPALFEVQLKWLDDNGYKSMNLDELVHHYRHHLPIDPKTVVITFDDGYLDNYETAFPLLKKYGFTATIFLVADLVGTVTNWEGQREPIPLMNWEQAREMQTAGFSFGSHTRTHLNLKHATREQARDEIANSRKIIEDKLGVSVNTIAYPYEAFTQETLKIVEESGYAGGCGSPAHAETVYNLWRAECFSYTTMDKFMRKVSRWRDTYMWLKHLSIPAKTARRMKKMLKS
jgi:peptidoglycan/xylan/chitin deacetylase (PgdA/CDA1 family)